MSYSLFHIIHLFSLFLLTGITFAAFASPTPENRRRCLMWGGIASMAVLISGLGLMGMLKIGVPGWLWIKLLCWLLLSAVAGVAFRRANLVPTLLGVSLVLIGVAVAMVSLKPF